MIFSTEERWMNVDIPSSETSLWCRELVSSRVIMSQIMKHSQTVKKLVNCVNSPYMVRKHMQLTKHDTSCMNLFNVLWRGYCLTKCKNQWGLLLRVKQVCFASIYHIWCAQFSAHITAHIKLNIPPASVCLYSIWVESLKQNCTRCSSAVNMKRAEKMFIDYVHKIRMRCFLTQEKWTWVWWKQAVLVLLISNLYLHVYTEQRQQYIYN